MIIVLEGIDKQGKSSLADHLSKMFGMKIKKFSKPEGDPYIEYMKFLLTNKEPVILDRFHLGELAYGPVKRGKSGLNEWQLRNIEMLLLMRNALTIYCYTDEVTTLANFKKEKEDYAMPEDVPMLVKFFEAAQQDSHQKWFQFNYLNDPDYMGIDKLVAKWWNKTFNQIHHIKNQIDARVVGSVFSKNLVLGEVSNIELEQAKYKDVNVPFANGPSAELLYSILPPFSFALSNAKKAHNNNVIDLKAELSLPYLEKVICLGNEAYKALEEYRSNNNITKRILVYKVFHPAYILRGNESKEKYEKELKRLLI